ncbi:hypothetical protein HDU76_007400 [Blyttiomyces sp. JEL0837]|nr:hypothetical protein HDU76_007400 [Blyttiomyces sp. JEL0837]
MTPLQSALLAFLGGAIFFDIGGQGVHHVLPYLYDGFFDASILRSKVPASLRSELLSHFRALVNNTPLWFFVTLATAYCLLVVASLLNTAMDLPSRRPVHTITLLLTLLALAPVALRIVPGPAMRIATRGKGRLSTAEEIQALYDISFAVISAGAAVALALVVNLIGGADGGEEVVHVEKKKNTKKE